MGRIQRWIKPSKILVGSWYYVLYSIVLRARCFDTSPLTTWSRDPIQEPITIFINMVRNAGLECLNIPCPMTTHLKYPSNEINLIFSECTIISSWTPDIFSRVVHLRFSYICNSRYNFECYFRVPANTTCQWYMSYG